MEALFWESNLDIQIVPESWLESIFLLLSGAVVYLTAKSPRLAAFANFLHMFKSHSSLPGPGALLNLIKALPHCIADNL